jgi:hypothetical protein
MADTKIPPAQGDQNPFKDFIDSVRVFVDSSMSDLIKSAGNDEDAPLVQSTAETIQKQFIKVLDETSKYYSETNSMARANANDFLHIQSGTELVKSLTATTKKMANAKFGKGFFTWLAKNITEIKKLIGMILEFIWPAAAKWWDKISVFLDELVNLLLSLLGGIFGFNRMALAAEMSQAEVHYLNEMAALQRLTFARNGKSEDISE